MRQLWLVVTTTVLAVGAAVGSSVHAAPSPDVRTVGIDKLAAGGVTLGASDVEFGVDAFAARNAVLVFETLDHPVWVRCQIEHEAPMRIRELVYGAGKPTQLVRTIEPDGSGIVDFTSTPAGPGAYHYRFEIGTQYTPELRFTMRSCTITTLPESQ